VTVLIGSEALAAGELTRHELRTWSRRGGVVCGLAASALHGAKWVDSDVPIEMVSPNHRAPAGVITRNSTLSDDEVVNRGSMQLTTVERTAFDLALSGRVRQAVARLDALAAATHYKYEDVRELARRHPRLREIRRLDGVLDLVDAGAESPQESRVRLLLRAR
jgi:hypothetical protein